MLMALVCLSLDRLWVHPFSSLYLVTTVAVRNPLLVNLRAARWFGSVGSSDNSCLSSYLTLRECWSARAVALTVVVGLSTGFSP
jgi:hypothetical protein